MADISKIKVNGTAYNVKDSALAAEIAAARGSYANLDARLDAIDTIIGDINSVLEEVL